ncbi:MAG TPA: CpsB/CapC family capsule biosynthesis tyrosine phosphatase [Thermomicrobiaceae bacterium]|nr:CpsB/CapC family capsule biosynthesis tyrosine phosphatase [Thermomicrobiaceae bacterium]
MESSLALVDLHCHVLPNVDDGADDDEMALRMLRASAASGVARVVATPHAHHCPAELIPRLVERLNGRAKRAGIAIEVLPGQEVRLGAHIVERLAAGELLTLNQTRYLLLELPLSGSWPSYLDEVVDDLQARGYRPILAHAERYPDVQRNPRLVEPLVARGVPVQLNADSLGEKAERGARPAAEYLLAHHLAHLIASDAHSDYWRPPRLDAALARASELAGDSYGRWMIAASWSVLRGEPLDLPSTCGVAEPGADLPV